MNKKTCYKYLDSNLRKYAVRGNAANELSTPRYELQHDRIASSLFVDSEDSYQPARSYTLTKDFTIRHYLPRYQAGMF